MGSLSTNLGAGEQVEYNVRADIQDVRAANLVAGYGPCNAMVLANLGGNGLL